MYNIQKEGLFGKELPRLSNIHVTSSSTNQQSSKKEAASKPAPAPKPASAPKKASTPAPAPKLNLLQKQNPRNQLLEAIKLGLMARINRIQITVEQTQISYNPVLILA